MLPFVENAIKHSVTNDPAFPICISLSATPRKIDFEVTNMVNGNLKDEISGIGLANLKRRLKLQYPSTHLLKIEKKGEVLGTIPEDMRGKM